MSVVSAIADKPAMKNLITAFNRWQKEEPWVEDQSHTDTIMRKALTAVGIEPQEQSRLPEPAGVAFIMSLSLLSPASIPSDDRNCQICTQIYRHFAKDGDGCVATRLPCNHLFCCHCIIKWLNPMKGDNNSCPCCRREFFPKLPDFDTVEGLQARIEFFDWRAQDMVYVPQPEEKRMIQGLTRTIVSVRLEEARREFHVESQLAIRLLENEGVPDAKLSAPLTPKSPRPLLKLHLWETLIDVIGYQVHISNMKEEIEEDRARSTVAVQEALHRLYEGYESRVTEEGYNSDRRTEEPSLPGGVEIGVEEQTGGGEERSMRTE